MNQQSLRELFVDHIRDIYDAERQLVKALPKLAKAADSEELAEALRNHLAETQNQVARLEQVFESVGAPAHGKTCKGMKGLLAEGNEAVEDHEAGPMRDLAIVAGAQKVEHYEISAYGTARTLAEQLELSDAVDLLQQTEDEEKNADEKLTGVATSIYAEGNDEDEDEESEDDDEESDDDDSDDQNENENADDDDDDDDDDSSVGIPVPATAKKTAAKPARNSPKRPS